MEHCFLPMLTEEHPSIVTQYETRCLTCKEILRAYHTHRPVVTEANHAVH